MRLETVCTRYGLDTELTPTSLVQNMHLQVLRIIFFAWSRLFTVTTLRRSCEQIEKHEGILPVTRLSTKHCSRHLVFSRLHEESIGVIKAGVCWDVIKLKIGRLYLKAKCCRSSKLRRSSCNNQNQDKDSATSKWKVADSSAQTCTSSAVACPNGKQIQRLCKFCWNPTGTT